MKLICFALVVAGAMVKSKAATEQMERTDLIAIQPSSAPSDVLSNGVVHLEPNELTNIHQILSFYANLSGKSILLPATLPNYETSVSIANPLATRDALHAFDAVLGLNGIAMIPGVDNAVHAEATSGCEGSHSAEFVTHLLQVSDLRPSDLVPALKSLASVGSGAICPIDINQLLVIKDDPENVRRMRAAIRFFEAPAEFFSEVVPIRYAPATEIQVALNSRGTNVALKKVVEQILKTTDKDQIADALRFNFLMDQRSNSLLLFGTRQEVNAAKNISAGLIWLTPKF